MSYRVKYICVIFMIIGAIGIAINVMFGSSTIEWFTRIRVGNQWIWRFNTSGYIKNIAMSFQDTGKLALELPSRIWDDPAIDGWWETLMNNLAIIIDYIILIGNILIYPFRVGGYLIQQVLAIIGVNIIHPNVNSGLYWLVQVAEWMQEANIAYI